MSNTTYDAVHKPPHYNFGTIECIEYIHQVLGDDGFIAYCRGNAMKYQHRVGYKGNPAEDIAKATWYLTRASSVLEGTNDT